MSIEIDDDVFSEFAAEALERLNSIEEMLLDMESSSNQVDDIKQIFRDIHTIKGNSQFLGIENIKTLSHAFEDMFGALRTDTIALSKELVDASLEGVDSIRSWIEEKDLETPAPAHLYTLMKKITAGDVIASEKVTEPPASVSQPEPIATSEPEPVMEADAAPQQSSGGMIRVFSVEPAHFVYLKLYGEFSANDLGEQLSGILFDYSSSEGFEHFVVDVSNLPQLNASQSDYLTRFVHEADIFNAKACFMHASESFAHALDTDAPMLNDIGELLSCIA